MKYFILFLSVLISNCINAQSLPNVQKHGLRAPANVLIDGKPTEWNNKLLVHNSATNINYMLSNDDNNLYLVVQSGDPDVLSKITNRGVQFIINTSGKRDSKDAPSVTYPVFDLQYGNKPYIRFSNAGGLTHDQRLAIEANPDSMLRVANKKLHDSEKYILTRNLPDVDTLISVYNESGIMAREGFGKGMVYTYELALPLKYLKLSAANAPKFFYHIILAGINIDNDYGMKTTQLPDGRMLVTMAPGSSTGIVSKEHLPAVTSTTDFWGEYTLARKP